MDLGVVKPRFVMSEGAILIISAVCVTLSEYALVSGHKFRHCPLSDFYTLSCVFL